MKVSTQVITGLAIGLGLGALMLCGRESKREAVVRIANSQLGQGDLREYYESACLPDNYTGEWCGIFALWCLHEAGIAPSVCWIVGKGFLYRLPLTNNPLPGDIGYKDAPYQHHAIIESYDSKTGKMTTINGNGAGGVVTRTTISTVGYVFYSIAPWVD